MRFNIFLYFILTSNILISQSFEVQGYLIDSETNDPITNVNVLNIDAEILCKTNKLGYFNFSSKKKILELLIIHENYYNFRKIVDIRDTLKLTLRPLSVEIDEIKIIESKYQDFKKISLNDIEETSIYAGKKSEVILIDDISAGLAINNPRLIYNQISGLNIYETDDAGIQLNIGGRGLDPSRSSNFNTRQNGYDISADVLGYPESYYTPPSESLERIEIIRGAASLQYGTQFGGLINFKIKRPSSSTKINIINTIGSNNLFTNYTSLSGTLNKFRYYTFFNSKKGDGFRDNSSFNSKNIYSNLVFDINEKINISTEVTYFTYLAQQAGGLTDRMFNKDPIQSNRTRNWFHVDWLLLNTKLNHKININNHYTISIFGLKAQREALGFRTNRVDQIDALSERDLIIGDFNNFGIETKFISKNHIYQIESISLIGGKYYQSLNNSSQGPGSSAADPNFNFQYEDYPYYIYQSNYTYPNQNIALFGENVFYLKENFSVTPGIRYEYISTQSRGSFRNINLDAAANPIYDTIIFQDQVKDRSFFLTGIGLSYKTAEHEIFANISQNYRSVTFSDISIISPSYMVDPNITDETGNSFDIGIRGKFNNDISYDLSSFQMLYNNRIGFVQRELENGIVKSVRSNIGEAKILGLESLVDFHLSSSLFGNLYRLNYFINTSFIHSEYIHSEENGIIGNEVEFVPNINLKTGFTFQYNNFTSNFQFTHLSSQYTDATNAFASNLSGVIGIIPSYSIIDFSSKYQQSKFSLEFGINNLLNTNYFTRRAAGYPGPGIIPSPIRNYYLTFQINI